LNRIQGKDDLGLRAELLREVLKTCPRKEVLAILPETTESLKAMASTGQDTIAEYLQAWQNAQSARLKHLTFQLTFSQLDMVEEALAQAMPMAKGQRGASPNNRGTALYLVCKAYLKEGEYRCLLNTP